MRRFLKGLCSRLPHPLNSRRISRIPGRVHWADSMLPADDDASVASYIQAGQSGLAAIARGLEASGKQISQVSSALDLGCGYGRVLRYLCDQVDPQRISSCDLDARAVAFCSAELGTRALLSRPDFRDVPFESYDLIWSGSLLTHLPEAASETLLSLLPSLLNPGGVAVISFHGAHSLSSLGDLYGGDHASEARAIRDEVGSRGSAYRAYSGRFVGYSGEADYGMAWHRWEFLKQRCEHLSAKVVRATLHIPRGWDDHHDLAVFQRSEA